MEKIYYKLFIRIGILLISFFAFGMGIYSFFNSALHDRSIAIGIILIVLGFYGIPSSIIGIIKYSTIERIAKFIYKDNLYSPSKIAKEARMNEETVKTIMILISTKNLIDGFSYSPSGVNRIHDEHCLVCKHCGAHLLSLDGLYCEFCGEKL